MAQAYSDLHRIYLSGKGIKLNNNGGFYRCGKSYGVETKLHVVAVYVDARDKRENMRHSPDFIYFHRIKSNLPRNKQTKRAQERGEGVPQKRRRGGQTRSSRSGDVLLLLLFVEMQVRGEWVKVKTHTSAPISASVFCASTSGETEHKISQHNNYNGYN